MTIYLTPIQANLPWYFFSTTLSGNTYILRLRYNSRMQRWVMDIADAANNTIIAGMVLLINRNANGQYVAAGVPPGVFFAYDDSSQGTEATEFSFSIDHSLNYIDPTT